MCITRRSQTVAHRRSVFWPLACVQQQINLRSRIRTCSAEQTFTTFSNDHADLGWCKPLLFGQGKVSAWHSVACTTRAAGLVELLLLPKPYNARSSTLSYGATSQLASGHQPAQLRCQSQHAQSCEQIPGRAECMSSASGWLSVANSGMPTHVCGNAAPPYATPRVISRAHTVFTNQNTNWFAHVHENSLLLLAQGIVMFYMPKHIP